MEYGNVLDGGYWLRRTVCFCAWTALAGVLVPL